MATSRNIQVPNHEFCYLIYVYFIILSYYGGLGIIGRYYVLYKNVSCIRNIHFLVQVVAKGMIKSKQGGSIVQISSLGSKMAFRGGLIYLSSKAAVDQMMKVMALEWGPHQVG